MWATGSDPEFIPAINNQPRNDRVGERPKRRSEAGSGLIEPRVTIEFACKLQSPVDKARKGQIELLIFVEASRLPDEEFGGIEIEMNCMNTTFNVFTPWVVRSTSNRQRHTQL